jgi:hypothetical protein
MSELILLKKLLNSSESHLASELERIKKILDTKDGVVKD